MSVSKILIELATSQLIGRPDEFYVVKAIFVMAIWHQKD
jgi:hypothetical protein